MPNSNLSPVKVLSDGRRYKRFVKEGSISIHFRDEEITGNLVNLSATGVLANFNSSSKFPDVAENVMVHITVNGEENAMIVPGSVVRLQPPKDYDGQDILELAVSFIGLSPADRDCIQKLINYLLVKSKSYKL